MPYCSGCGTLVADGAAFCSGCGTSQSSTAVPAGIPVPPVAQTGLAENFAGLLAYILGWITGLIFLIIDKRPFVRFHAAQSLIAFGILNILSVVVSVAFLGGGFFGGGIYTGSFYGIWLAVRWLIDIVSLIVWIVGMMKAYRHERFRIPIVADFADKLAGSALAV